MPRWSLVVLVVVLGLVVVGCPAYAPPPDGEGPTDVPPGEDPPADEPPVIPPPVEPPDEEPPGEEPPVEEPPAEEPPVEEPPAEEPPAEEPPSEEPPAEEPPVEEPPVDEPPAEEPPVDEPPVDVPPPDEPPAEEPPTEEPPAEEPPVEEPPAEEPPVDEPPAEGWPDLGPNADLRGAQVLPSDNPWNTPVDMLPVDPNSDTLIDSIGRWDHIHPDFGANWNGGPFGIPYIVVGADTPGVEVEFYYDDESDHAPYPITADTPIEGGPDSDGDRHMIMIDRDNWFLYELYDVHPPAEEGGPHQAGSGAIWDLTSNDVRPDGWTSADAAGLPIFPGLVRYDEAVGQGEIAHAFRFTVRHSRRAYVYPARHYASNNSDPALPPMGMRVRLKADFDISGFSETNQVILRALKKYGMIVADNGSDWYISGAPDARWSDDELNELKSLVGDNFEVVEMGEITVGK